MKRLVLYKFLERFNRDGSVQECKTLDEYIDWLIEYSLSYLPISLPKKESFKEKRKREKIEARAMTIKEGRLCKKCDTIKFGNENLKLSEFSFSKTSLDGFYAWCKDCQNEYAQYINSQPYLKIRFNERKGKKNQDVCIYKCLHCCSILYKYKKDKRTLCKDCIPIVERIEVEKRKEEKRKKIEKIGKIKCTTCDKKQPFSSFLFNNGAYGIKCAKCRSKEVKKNYWKDPEKSRKKSREGVAVWKEKNPEKYAAIRSRFFRLNPNYLVEWAKKNPRYFIEWAKRHPGYAVKYYWKNKDKICKWFRDNHVEIMGERYSLASYSEEEAMYEVIKKGILFKKLRQAAEIKKKEVAHA